MAHLLGAEALHLEFATKTVFDGVTVGISEGDRIGIVGRNGDGKSTLLKLLAGRIEPDSGRVTKRGGVTVGMLDQADTLPPEQTVGEAVVGGRDEHEWAGDARVRDVIAGLVSDIAWDAPIGELSGGQQRRVALAALLTREWDVVFLDEPTNHLDVEGIAWLAKHLRERWPKNQGGLVVVTHDRWFLDEVCTATWEVHDRVLEPFEGGYAAYVLQRVERDRMAAASEAKRQNLMRKELAWLRRGAPARTAKPKFRIDAANALIENEPPVRNQVSLTQLATSRLGKDVVDIEDASVSFGERRVLDRVTWRIAPGERTGILGVNGAGKSTLLGLVSGTVTPTSGRVKRGKTVEIASLTQQLEELAEHEHEPIRTVIGRLRTAYAAGDKELTPGQLLERLGFTSAQLSTPIRDLSGGQRRRLQLLLILLREPNVLILDEPTNDMDTDMLAAIEDLLDTWPGTLLVVSHDRYLLERVTDQQYAVLDGHLRHLPGGVDEYLRLRASGAGSGAASRKGAAGSAPAPRGSAVAAGAATGGEDASAPAPTHPSAPSTTPPRTPSGLTGAERRTAEKELSALERRMSRLQQSIRESRDALALHDQADYLGLSTKMTAITALEAELEALEERWLKLGEQLG